MSQIISDKKLKKKLNQIKKATFQEKHLLIKELLLNPEGNNTLLILKYLFENKYVMKKLDKDGSSKISIVSENNFNEILEDIYMELLEYIRGKKVIKYSDNLYIYIKNQLKWRTLKKNRSPIKETGSIIHSGKDSKDIIESNVITDNSNLYEGLDSFFEYKPLVKELSSKNFKPKIDENIPEKHLKYYKYIFERVFSFLAFEEVISNKQKYILMLRISNNKQFEDITKNLRITLNVAKKQFYKAVERMIIFLLPNDDSLNFEIDRFTGLDFIYSDKEKIEYNQDVICYKHN